MNDQAKQSLLERNTALIEILQEKIKRTHPNSADLIGISGSFATGDFSEKSDLDLLIVADELAAKELNTCFILDSIGFDFYCTSWEKLAHMATYPTPHIAKLVTLKVCYTKDPESQKRYQQLSEQVKLALQNTEENAKKATSHFSQACEAFGKLLLCRETGAAYKHLYHLLTRVEYALFTINGAYFKRGIKRIPEELSELEKLPANFLAPYQAILKTENLTQIQQLALELMSTTSEFLEIMSKLSTHSQKATYTEKDITGTYEEIVSNWKGKVESAVASNDVYSQFMAQASCQEFYDEMNEKFALSTKNILRDFSVTSTYGNADAFNKGLETWKQNYEAIGMNVRQYKNIDEFRADYLK